MSACSGKDCKHSIHKSDSQKVLEATLPQEQPNPYVPAVPKVKGLKVKKILGRPMTICECGNAHPARFAKRIKEGVELDERYRKHYTKTIYIRCTECGTERLQKEIIKEANSIK